MPNCKQSYGRVSLALKVSNQYPEAPNKLGEVPDPRLPPIVEVGQNTELRDLIVKIGCVAPNDVSMLGGSIGLLWRVASLGEVLARPTWSTCNLSRSWGTRIKGPWPRWHMLKLVICQSLVQS